MEHHSTINQLLIEQIKTRTGYQIFIFPFEGRLVHEGLAALTAYRISKIIKLRSRWRVMIM